MISQYLQSIHGMQMVGVVSLIVCIALFLFVVVRAIRADKKFLRHMSQLPLDADNPQAMSSEKVQQ